jgi:hypothetical protein
VFVVVNAQPATVASDPVLNATFAFAAAVDAGAASAMDEPTGADEIATEYSILSPSPNVPVVTTVKVVDTFVPTLVVIEGVVSEGVAAVIAAEAGITDSRPKPNADTATSAMRLIDVLVDICFLSISRVREFPALGLDKKFLLICQEREIWFWAGRMNEFRSCVLRNFLENFKKN